jgi:hypothetical protein
MQQRRQLTNLCMNMKNDYFLSAIYPGVNDTIEDQVYWARVKAIDNIHSYETIDATCDELRVSTTREIRDTTFNAIYEFFK